MKSYTSRTFIDESMYAEGIHWIWATGEDIEIKIRKKDSGMTKTYGLRGRENGSITVRGKGYASVRRAGDGHGDARLIGKIEGDSRRSGFGKGDSYVDSSRRSNSYRTCDGNGNAYKFGDSKGLALKTGSGKGYSMCVILTPELEERPIYPLQAESIEPKEHKFVIES